MLCGDASNDVYIFWRDANGTITGNEKVRDNRGEEINKGSRYSIPQVFDWNSDGLPDLLVGAAADSYYKAPHPDAGKDKPGLIWLYLNTGTSSSPEFTFEKVVTSQAGDSIASPAYSSFAMGDLDGDNLADIVTVGALKDSTGYFRFWKNIGTAEDPQFESPIALRKKSGELVDNVGYTRFVIYDYNKDTIPDILYRSGQKDLDGNSLLANYLWVMYGEPQSINIVTQKSNPAEIEQLSFTSLGKKQLSISGEISTPLEIQIFSSQGRVMDRITLHPGMKSCSLENLSPGLYLLLFPNGKRQKLHLH